VTPNGQLNPRQLQVRRHLPATAEETAKNGEPLCRPSDIGACGESRRDVRSASSAARTGPRRRRHDRPPARRQSRRSQQHGDSDNDNDNDHKTTTPGARQSPARQPSTAPKLTPRFRKAEASERLGCGRPWLLLLVGDPPERQSAAEFSVGDEAAAPHSELSAPGTGSAVGVGRLQLAPTEWF
jgi:hypothetical protein